MISRRSFIKLMVIAKAAILNNILLTEKGYSKTDKETKLKNQKQMLAQNNRYGNIENGVSEVFKITNGTPEENMRALVGQIGGIDKLVGRDDIVVLKPNAQWWVQGMTNTDAIKAFIEIILNSYDFQGEIIIAENHQYLDFNGRGWSTDQPNGKYNYNELIKYFNRKGHPNVSSYHWRAAGPNPDPIEGDDDGSGGKRVSGPGDGDGYVWRDDIVYRSPEGNDCWMTYPVFTSKYSGVTVDLKYGAWKNGSYLKDRSVKFINFSALNHHGWYCGVTASVKNLMGVVDMSCGFQAPNPEDTYNVHFIGVKKYIRHIPRIPSRHLTKLRNYLYRKTYENFHYTGGALGKFIQEIRRPDLNIITAHWVGWGSRWDTSKSSYPKAILASTDPVALDYIAAKDILLPATPPNEKWFLRLNNPDILNGPFYKFLRECHLQGVGNLDENKIRRIEIAL